MVIGMPKLQQPVNEVCEGCALGNLHRLPFKKDGKGDVKAIRALQIVHSDVCGPMNVTTHRGARYFVTFIDDYSAMVLRYQALAPIYLLDDYHLCHHLC